MKKFLLFLGLIVSAAASAQTEIQSYQSGIDIVLTGTRGTAYQIQQLYYLPTTNDEKIIYVKSTTPIGFAHNSMNIAFINNQAATTIGVLGQDGLPNSGDEGQIMYRLDRDMNYGGRWGDAGGAQTFHNFNGSTTNVPQFNNTYYTQIDSVGHTFGQTGYFFDTPFTLASLTYESGVPVVGTVGPKPGQAVTDWANYYWRGITDSFGDEWHTFYLADNEIAIKNTGSGQTGWQEWVSTDSKIFLVVVNPLTPCFSPSVTGTGQFYTTPAKAYNAVKICNQITYFSAGISGTVVFQLQDINGNNVFYRIGGIGAFQGGTSPTVTLHDTDFVTGSQTLEYYYSGQVAHTKTMVMVKDPDYPSAGETHGSALFGNAAGLAALKVRLGLAPWAAIIGQYPSQNMYNHQNDLDTIIDTGRRNSLVQAPNPGIVANAFICLVNNNWTAIPAGKTRTFAQYSKQALLQCAMNIAPVGQEIECPDTYMPCREIYYRGYYDVDESFELAFGYDLLIANYKATQVAGGITPVEDYFARDKLAVCAFYAMQQEQNYSNQQFSDPGMWGTSRNVGASIIAQVIYKYKTPYYGTSGFDGSTNTDSYTPFPDTPLTWKQVFYDNTVTLTGYPNLNYRFGVEEYMFDDTGNFTNRGSYLDYALIGHVFYTLGNFNRMFFSKVYPRMERGFQRLAIGNMVGLQAPSEGLFHYPGFTIFNNRFAVPYIYGLPWSLSQPTSGAPTNGNNNVNTRLFATWTWGLCWYQGPGVIVPGSAMTPSLSTP